jgi:spore germination cell wall hydrolase CwlJ-like protein
MKLIKIILIVTLFITTNSVANAQQTPDFVAEVRCLATNIYFEARGEPIKGQIAVAMVTLNRVNDSRFPDNICDVIHQSKQNSDGKPIRCQFSWYCDGKSDKISYDSPEAKLAITIAINAMISAYKDVTSGALYFSDDKNKIPKNSENVIEIGNHVFYRRG